MKWTRKMNENKVGLTLAKRLKYHNVEHYMVLKNCISHKKHSFNKKDNVLKLKFIHDENLE